jgi:hypothetical protein
MFNAFRSEGGCDPETSALPRSWRRRIARNGNLRSHGRPGSVRDCFQQSRRFTPRRPSGARERSAIGRRSFEGPRSSARRDRTSRRPACRPRIERGRCAPHVDEPVRRPRRLHGGHRGQPLGRGGDVRGHVPSRARVAIHLDRARVARVSTLRSVSLRRAAHVLARATQSPPARRRQGGSRRREPLNP